MGNFFRLLTVKTFSNLQNNPKKPRLNRFQALSGGFNHRWKRLQTKIVKISNTRKKNDLQERDQNHLIIRIRTQHGAPAVIS